MTQEIADGVCKCGRPYEGYYAAYHQECHRCEALREGEAVLAADMILSAPARKSGEVA